MRPTPTIKVFLTTQRVKEIGEWPTILSARLG